MIRFENVSKKYDDGFIAVDLMNLHINEGELLVLIGPSGCGKTTTMKMINRLIDPSEGSIYINEKKVDNLNPVELRRNVGYVIQHIGLLPHMTIAENIALVPKLKKWPKEKYIQKVDELLKMVHLDPEIYRDRYPSELSGGQQQRVGVVRALAADPPIILMDEPFSALDPISREQLQEELIRLQEEIKKTIVFVTHDMDEALKIADRICIMRDGKILQLDTPENILRHPANDFVKSFIGEERLNDANILPDINEVMVKPIVSRGDRGMAESVKFMRKNKVDSILIIDKEDKLLGKVSIWEIQKHYENETMRLSDIMIKDIKKISIDKELAEAIGIIDNYNLTYLPVVDDAEKLLGVITRGSLVGIMANRYNGN